MIELLIVMSVLAVVLTTATITLFRLLHAQSAGTTALAESLTVSRLAHDLRRDAHAARTAALTLGDDGVRLTFAGGPAGDVTYTAKGSTLLRRGTTGDGTASTEDYRLGAVAVELDLTESNRLAVIRLQAIVPDPVTATGQSQPLQHRPRTITTLEAAIAAGR